MRTHRESGFTLVEMIMVIVITGIIGGMVAVFLKAPIQQYMDVARRAELTDIADTAVRRMARDVRIAVPNSVRVPSQTGCDATPTTPCYVEFLPTKDGGRYRANTGGNNNILIFGTGGTTTFDIVGAGIPIVADPNLDPDYIVVGSTQSEGVPPYDEIETGILRKVTGITNSDTTITFASPVLPAWAELASQRFSVVDGAQQAVTYACVATAGTVAADDGPLSLMRYWGYGFKSTQLPPPAVEGGSTVDSIGAVVAHSEAVLADKVSHCEITYEVPNQRFGLLAVRLTLTSGGESVSLYNEIHVNNAP